MTAENTETAGGSRYSSGKPVVCYAPYGGLHYVEEVSVRGAEKYAPFDYLNGQSFSTLLSSGFRHWRASLRNPTARDPESGLYHMAHAAWNALCLLDFIAQGRTDELDDITPWLGITAAERRALIEKYPDNPRAVLAELRKRRAPKEESNAGDDTL